MREILPALDRWQQQGEEIALATLVGVQGSAPRPSGARLALTRSGHMVGSVSGGCVENDVYEHALEVLREGRATVVRYGIADELSVAVGLSCGGEIEVLIEPFRSDAAWQTTRQAVEQQQPVVLAIALQPAGLAGRRLAFTAGGNRSGGIDPGLDDALLETASSLLAEGGRRSVDLAWRGETGRVYLEAFLPQPRLLIVGATHTGMTLCALAKRLDFRVTVIDPRSAFATAERFPEADALLRDWPQEAVKSTQLDEHCYVVSLSHDLKLDLPTLVLALRGKPRYIGALGSRKTHEKRKARLREEGFGEADLARIHTPIGLDIGARSPEEIALAILAEIVAVRRSRSGGALSARQP